MKIEKNSDFQALKKRHAPSSPCKKNILRAFLSGGFICGAGQCLFFLYSYLGANQENSYTLVTLSFIFLSALLTSLGIFDRFARFCGAGTLLPVTGFANSVTSSAIDARSEGFISGIGVKIFAVAGPVILYATLAGTLYGFIYFFIGLF